jgi:hypothetical protein
MSKKLTDEEILEQRAVEYGDAKESFSSIASMWSSYLGKEIDGKDVCMLMVLLKVHRSKTSKDFHFKDSLQDARNYLTLAERITND